MNIHCFGFALCIAYLSQAENPCWQFWYLWILCHISSVIQCHDYTTRQKLRQNATQTADCGNSKLCLNSFGVSNLKMQKKHIILKASITLWIQCEQWLQLLKPWACRAETLELCFRAGSGNAFFIWWWVPSALRGGWKTFNGCLSASLITQEISSLTYTFTTGRQEDRIRK